MRSAEGEPGLAWPRLLRGGIVLMLLVSAAGADAIDLSTLNAFCNAGKIPGGVQPRPAFSQIRHSADGTRTWIRTAGPALAHPELRHAESMANRPNTAGLLTTVYSDAVDCGGDFIPNTLPSHPDRPYNLQAGEPKSRAINATSPSDELRLVLADLATRVDAGEPADLALVQRGIDVLEGNPIADREFSGFPLLHYTGPTKVKKVAPQIDEHGRVTGGEVVVNQIWFDTQIESDTAWIDALAVDDVPWTIRYRIKVLSRSVADFAPYVMYFDDPYDLPGQLHGMRIPHVGLDQTFFPMREGMQYEFVIRMAPARYYNLTYHWSWRKHPPKVQVHENLRVRHRNGQLRNYYSVAVFGDDPRENTASKRAAIAQIGELAPAKRLWRALHAIRQLDPGPERRSERRQVLLTEAQSAFDDWQHRTRLPRGIDADPEADVTLAYLNNTLYGSINGLEGDAEATLPQWQRAGDVIRVRLLNGDYFVHAYELVDFGGLRGWENTFHPTVAAGGSGPWFTFGRNHFWLHASSPASGPIEVPAANRSTGVPGEHLVEIEFNHEPAPRLRMYQFDPYHHDTAIWSIH